MACESEKKAVNAAMAQVKALQAELKIAVPTEKPRIIVEIHDAQDALDNALAALAACKDSQPAQPPSDVVPGTIRINLDYLSCSVSYEGTWGGGWEEPYLMVFPLVINLERIGAKDYVQNLGASHGNVGYQYQPGVSRFIGNMFGSSFPSQTFPFFAGVLVLCFEEDFTPNSQVHAAYKEIRTILNKGIDGIVQQVLQGTITLDAGLPEIDIKAMTKLVEDAIYKHYSVQPFNPDDFIGMGIQFATLGNTSVRQVIRFKFDRDGSEYGLIGRIAFDP